MKSSLYNVYTKDDTGYTVFNTLTWAVGHMDQALKTLLEKDPDSIPEDMLPALLENGFITKDNYDERKKLAYYFDKDKYNVVPLNFMYIVAVTYACNLRCPYCYEGYEKDSTLLTNKKVDILLKNIDKTLKKRNFREFQLGLYGGEPLLGYDQCRRLMEGAFNICEEQGKQVSGNIVTNGVLITEEVITNLLAPYCDLIQITMDGGRTAHNKRRILKNGGGTYDILLDVIELLNNAGITPDIRLNVDRENASTFGDLFKDIRERGLTDIRVSLGWIHPPDERVLGEGCPGYSDLCFSHKEMADFEEIIFHQMDELEIFYEKPRLSKHSPCTFDREDIYLVDPYLDLYNCWEFLGQKDKKVGCITKDGETVFYYEYYEQMSRDPFAFAECSNCVYLPLCGGGCAARAYLENGTYHSPSCGRYTYTAQKCIDAFIREQ